MKTIKIITIVIWAAFGLLALLFGITWLTGSDAALGWGYLAILAPIVATLTGLYFMAKTILNRHGKLY